MIDFKCPYCDSLQRVAEGHGASHAWCKSCKRIIPVPAADEPAGYVPEPRPSPARTSFTSAFDIEPPEEDVILVPDSALKEAAELSWEPWEQRNPADTKKPAPDGTVFDSWLGEAEPVAEDTAPAESVERPAVAQPAPKADAVVWGPGDLMPDIEDDIRNQPLASQAPEEAELQSVAPEAITEETEPAVAPSLPEEMVSAEVEEEAEEAGPGFARTQLDALSENIESALAMAEEQIEEIRDMARTLEAERDALRAQLEQALSDLAEARARREEAVAVRHGYNGQTAGLAHEDISDSEAESAGRPEVISEEESKGLSAMLESFMRFTNSD